jgi:hypothetical protein
MDQEAWYSVTPEGIARHLARFIRSKCPGSTIVDAFCGVFCPFSFMGVLTCRLEVIPFNLLDYLIKVIPEMNIYTLSLFLKSHCD